MSTGEDSDGEVTAGLLVIGDEILSGRTKDQNIGYIADHCTAIGIRLREVRIVADVEDEIVEALNAMRASHTYLFTTGGIGPTHDDITADAVAKAFGVSIDHHPQVKEICSRTSRGAASRRRPGACAWRGFRTERRSCPTASPSRRASR